VSVCRGQRHPDHEYDPATAPGRARQAYRRWCLLPTFTGVGAIHDPTDDVGPPGATWRSRNSTSDGTRRDLDPGGAHVGVVLPPVSGTVQVESLARADCSRGSVESSDVGSAIASTTGQPGHRELVIERQDGPFPCRSRRRGCCSEETCSMEPTRIVVTGKWAMRSESGEQWHRSGMSDRRAADQAEARVVCSVTRTSPERARNHSLDPRPWSQHPRRPKHTPRWNGKATRMPSRSPIHRFQSPVRVRR